MKILIYSLLGLLVVAGGIYFGMNTSMVKYQMLISDMKNASPRAAPPPAKKGPPEPAPDLTQWNGEHAMDLIARQISFGSRALGKPGHEKEIAFIREQLGMTSAMTELQQWVDDDKKLSFTNIVARFDPNNPRRIILATHYDSVVRAYRDEAAPTAYMPGANNSASGVAVLLETARMLSSGSIHPSAGIDLVFFDGSEGEKSLGEGDSHWQPLGSPYFATHLDRWYPTYRPLKAVVYEMVCYKDLKLTAEKLSQESAAGEVKKFWDIGRTLAPKIFMPNTIDWVSDDHDALARAGIPSILVIGADYKPWFNTTKDTFDKCAASSLEAVGRTTIKYILQD